MRLFFLSSLISFCLGFYKRCRYSRIKRKTVDWLNTRGRDESPSVQCSHLKKLNKVFGFALGFSVTESRYFIHTFSKFQGTTLFFVIMKDSRSISDDIDSLIFFENSLFKGQIHKKLVL